MGIQIIDYNGASPYAKTGTTNKVQQAGGDFQNTVMKCTGTTTQKTALYSDALMSYASPQTGESVNIYKAENYSKDNPLYVIKGLDADGNEFEKTVDASKINLNNCSFNELMVLNVETGHTSPGDYLRAVAVRANADAGSYFENADYIAYAQEVMEDYKTLGNWDSYLAMNKWIQSLLEYTNSAEMKTAREEQQNAVINDTVWKGDMLVSQPPDYSRFPFDNSVLSKSKEDMTLSEYKQWVMNELSQLPVSGWVQSSFSSGALVIKEEAFENMKNDPEFEEYVLNRVRSLYSANGLPVGSNNVCYEVIGGSPEECYGYAGPVGGGNAKIFDKDESWWQERHEEFEELLEAQAKAAQKKAQANRALVQEEYLNSQFENAQRLRAFLESRMQGAMDMSSALGNVGVVATATTAYEKTISLTSSMAGADKL